MNKERLIRIKHLLQHANAEIEGAIALIKEHDQEVLRTDFYDDGMRCIADSHNYRNMERLRSASSDIAGIAEQVEIITTF